MRTDCRNQKYRIYIYQPIIFNMVDYAYDLKTPLNDFQ